MKYPSFIHFLVLLLLLSCKSSIKEKKDELYSRHLQRHVQLRVITTPMPDDKKDMNLLLYLDAGEFSSINPKHIIDSLYKEDLIQPLVLVGIDGNAGEYGIARLQDKPAKFESFVINELYPFSKKRAATRKFHQVVTWGVKKAGTAALDLAWNNADKIDKAGTFSGTFDFAGRTDSSTTVLNSILQSRKRPSLDYWLFAAVDDSINYHQAQKLVAFLERKNSGNNREVKLVNGEQPKNEKEISRQFARFLVWAFGKQVR